MNIHIEGCTFTDCDGAIELSKCDVCGFASETAVSLFPDNVFRCVMCASKAAHGRYVSLAEVVRMSNAQLIKHIEKNDAWLNRLKEGNNGNA